MRFIRQIRDDTPRAVAREQIRRLIAYGGFRRGDQLPTYAELCDRFEVSLLTVQRAMGDLAKQGLVYRLHGKGCYVGKATSSGPRPLSQVGLVFNASISLLLQTPYLNQILTGTLNACNAQDIDLTILALGATKQRIPPEQLAAQVDAVMLLGIASEEYALQFANTNTPLVIVDNYFPAIPADTIVLDNATALRLVIRHLIGLGHRRIAFLGGFTSNPFTHARVDSSDSQERHDEYLSEMKAANLADGIRVIRTSEAQLDEAAAMAKSDRAPTAFLADDAPLALLLYKRLTAEGFRIPHDVSVAGVFGNETEISSASVPVTCCKANFHDMGVQAINSLVRRCRMSKPANLDITRIPAKLAIGATTAAPGATP